MQRTWARSRHIPDSFRDLDTHHSAIDTGNSVLAIAMWLFGFTSALGRFLDYKFGSLRITLSLGVLFGLLGWWQGVQHPILRRYLRWAVPFVVIGAISLIAAAPRTGFSVPVKGGFDQQGATLLWFMAVPGIAVVLQNRRLFRTLLSGLIAGAAVFLFVALNHAMRGQVALNKNDEMLRTHRNIIDMIVVWLVPMALAAPMLGWRKFARYAYIGGTIAWMISSNGRAGMLALILCPIVLFMLTPPKSGKPVGPRIAAAAACGFLIFNVLSNVTVSWLPAASRLSQSTKGDRTDSDEIRILLLKKAYTLAWHHPVFGIGLGNFPGLYDPIVEKAKNDHVRQQALTIQAHNTYVETMASTGFLGVFFFFGVVLVPLAAAIKYVRDRNVRAVAAGYCVVLFVITFHTALDTRLFIPMAATLAVAVQAANREESGQSLEATEDVGEKVR